MLFTSQSMTSKPPANFCGFGLEDAVPRRTMATVHHICQFSSTLAWITVLKRSSSNPEGIPERGLSLLSILSSLKRENHFLVMLSPMALPPYTPLMFLALSAAFAPLLKTREEYEVNVQISPLGTPFSSDHGSTQYLIITKLQYVNSSTTIELQIKMTIDK